MLTLVLACFMAAEQASAQIRINEIRTRDTEATNDDEYFELVGPPGASLADYFYIVLGDGTGGAGVVEFRFVVSGQATEFGPTGLVAARFIGPCDGDDPECQCIGDDCTSFVWCNNPPMENNDTVTHMLVTGFTGALDDDLDTNDDGVLDVTPWTGIVDSVTLFHSAASEPAYSANVVGPDPNTSGQPWHVFYCENAGWQIGTANPECTDDTVGAPNALCAAVSVDEPPAISWGRVKATFR
jgi:hypothetical protein